MSNIRVTYSGLISLAVGLSSIITGTVFTLIVTRQLSPEEFGTWGLIGGLITYVLIAEPIISYWTTREVARGVNSGKTALFSSGIFAIGGILVYLLVAHFVASSSDADEEFLLFAAILIPLMFIHKTATAINLGWKPQATSYGILVFELVKIPSALLFVYFMDLTVIGAILATAISYIGSIIILLIYAKSKIHQKIHFSYLRKWLKLSWLPVYPGTASLIFTLDVTIFSVITGSVIGLAYHTSSIAIASFVAHAGLISQALYAKFLGGGRQEYLSENLIRFFYFGFPLLALSLVLAKPGLFALNPAYQIAVPVVIFLTLRAFLFTLSRILDQTLQGVERVDWNEKATFKNFVDSKLFFLPTLRLIKYGIYAGSLLLILLIFSNQSQINLVIYWAIMSFIVEIPFLFYLIKLTKKYLSLKIPPVLVLKYAISTLTIFVIIHILLENYLIYVNRIFEFLPQLLLFVIFGTIAYLGLTYAIDKRTRILFHSIYDEIRKK